LKNRNYFIVHTTIIVLFALFFHCGCNQTDRSWHQYRNENFEVWGKARDRVELVTHRWKLIKSARPKHDFHEWGWEITIKINKSNDLKGSLIRIGGIEYTLYDSDSFKLTTNKLNLSNYRKVLRAEGEKGPILQEVGSTKTYRQTGYIISQRAKRASFGHCRILLESLN